MGCGEAEASSTAMNGVRVAGGLESMAVWVDNSNPGPSGVRQNWAACQTTKATTIPRRASMPSQKMTTRRSMRDILFL
jgi:chitodextrinase